MELAQLDQKLIFAYNQAQQVAKVGDHLNLMEVCNRSSTFLNFMEAYTENAMHILYFVTHTQEGMSRDKTYFFLPQDAGEYINEVPKHLLLAEGDSYSGATRLKEMTMDERRRLKVLVKHEEVKKRKEE